MLLELIKFMNDPAVHTFFTTSILPLFAGAVIFVKQILADRKRATQTDDIKSAITAAVADLQDWTKANFVSKPPTPHNIRKLHK